MRAIVRVYKWIVISVLLQLVILTYFNNYYLVREKDITVSNFDNLTNMTIDIPDGVSYIDASYDGSYISYVLDGKLQIVESKSEKNIKIIDNGSDILTYYRWMPDRNVILYSAKAPSNDAGRVQVTTFDVDSGKTHTYPKITGVPKGSEITDIQLSHLTNMVYVKVKTDSSQAKIYKYDIMDQLSFVLSTGSETVINETTYDDKIVYQDKNYKLFTRDGRTRSTWPFPFKSKMALLGIDGEDNVYVGELDKEGKVSKIRYGRLTIEPDKAWDQLSMKRAVLPENIIITNGGTVYEINQSESAVYDVAGDQKLSYKGKYIQITDNYLIAMNKDELKLTVLKK